MASISSIAQFLREVQAEAKRVQWPDARQTMVTTSVVLVFVLVTALFLFGVDSTISLLMKWVLK
ncbi:MAG: preprotein translocase subunit SecE [Candidatus Dadabacteria bacterium]|nr:MAG: preprotein translocase subunit SecE [Candidatus Dadabacteria bacterium]